MSILLTVRRKPGLTREEICNNLKVSLKSGSVSQNLVVLENLNLIKSTKGRCITQYYSRYRGIGQRDEVLVQSF